MARLNENFDSDENYLGPSVITHAIPRSPSKNARTTPEENQQSQAITNSQKSQIPPLEPAKPITISRSGKKSLRRHPLTPLYVNLLALPTPTDAIQSGHGLSYLYGPRNVKPRDLKSRMDFKIPANRINSASELPHIVSTVLEGRQATKDLSDYVVIDSTSETDDDNRGDSFQQAQREVYKSRVQKLPNLQLHDSESNVSGISARNFPSITADTNPSSKPVLEIVVADYSSSKANISLESRVPEPGSVGEDEVFFR